jgi:hypothetical protein
VAKNELGIDDKLLKEFEGLTDAEIKTTLRKRITEKHSRAPKPDIHRSLKLLQQGYRAVKTPKGEQHIKIPIHDIVTEILKCLKAGAYAENIPVEVATGWGPDEPAFDWADTETRTWVFFRARRVGVDPTEALRALDPALQRRPYRGPSSGISGSYSMSMPTKNGIKVARRRR